MTIKLTALMKKTLIFFLLTTNLFAQRNFPYPIILIHGLNNDDGSWYKNLQYFKSLGLRTDIDENRKGSASGSRLDFCLNADGDESKSVLNRKDGVNGFYGDVREYVSVLNENNDVFVVNFDVGACEIKNYI